MTNQSGKSKYWIRKWQESRWVDYKELSAGSIFDTAVQNHVQMADRVGDIIFWYRTDKDKKGIYFVTEVIAKPKHDDAYQNSWSMSVRVIKSLVDNPFIPEENGFKELIKKIDAKFQGGANYNILDDESLSLPAIGLLVYLISKPENWKIFPKYLATKLYKKQNSQASYRYILDLIQELELHGYCKKSKNAKNYKRQNHAHKSIKQKICKRNFGIT